MRVCSIYLDSIVRGMVTKKSIRRSFLLYLSPFTVRIKFFNRFSAKGDEIKEWNTRENECLLVSSAWKIYHSASTESTSTHGCHGRRKFFSQGVGTRGFFLKFSRGAKSGEIWFFRLKAKKTASFCCNFQNPRRALAPPVPPFRRPWWLPLLYVIQEGKSLEQLISFELIKILGRRTLDIVWNRFPVLKVVKQ